MKNKLISILLAMSILFGTGSAFAETKEATCDASDVKEYLADIVVNASQHTNGHLGSIGADAYIRIPRVDFKDKKYTSLAIQYGVDDSWAGATLSVYIDSMDRVPVAEFVLKSTGSFLAIESLETSIETDITGVHDVYVSFSRPAACDFVGLSFKTADRDIPDEVYDLSNKDKIVKLYKLGVLNYKSPFRPDKTVTNAEVLEAVRNISDMFTISNEEFEKKYLFAPSANATKESILKIFSLTAGYGDIGVFGDLNIFSQVVMKNNSITRKEFANCLDNFLNSRVAEGLFDTNISIKQSEKTVMNKCMGIYEIKGIVKSNGTTSVDGKKYTDEVLIGDTAYVTNGQKLEEYFGYNVKAYYKENDSGDNEIVVVIPYRNNELELTSDDDIQRSGLQLTYDDGCKTRRIKLDSSFVLIYNGIYTQVFDSNIFDTFYGTLKLIDNDNDNAYDFVIMSDTYDRIVTKVTNDEVIHGENGWSLDLKNVDYTIKTASGKVISENEIKGIKSGYVISVGQAEVNGKKVYTIYVSSQSVSGAIESKRNDNGTVVVKIDETEYKLSKYGTDNTACRNGDEATLVLSAFNRIMKIEKTLVERKFAYIDKVWIDDIDENIVVCIYNEDGEYIKAKCGDRLTVDGKKYKKFSDIKTVLTAEKNKTQSEKDIVTYLTDKDGKLVLIDYPYTYMGYKEATDLSKRRNNNEDENSIFISYKGSGKFKKDIMSIDGANVADSNAKVFLIPDDANDYEDYEVKTADSYFVQDSSYDVKAYGTNVNDIHSKAYLIFSSAAKEPKEIETVSYITNISTDSTYYDDNIYSQIYYLKNGGKYKALVKPNSSISKILPKLSIGDMVQMEVDSTGIVQNLEPMYLTDSGKIYDNDTAVAWGRTKSYVTSGFSTGRYVLKDKISRIIGSSAILENTGMIVEIETPKYFGQNFCIYDSAESDKHKVSAADVNDITEGSNVVLMVYYGSVNGLIVLK